MWFDRYTSLLAVERIMMFDTAIPTSATSSADAVGSTVPSLRVPSQDRRPIFVIN